MKLVTLGPKGTFAHQAALSAFKKAQIVFTDTIDSMFFRLGEKDIKEALTPIVNSFSGFAQETVINLMKYDFFIQGKTQEKVTHHLVGRGKIEDAEKLYAHPLAYKQCKDRLDALGVHCQVLETASNGHSALQVKCDNKEGSFAIVSPFAAKIYHLPILKQHIEDNPNHTITFLIIGKGLKKSTGKDCSAFLLFSDPMKAVENQIRTLIKGYKCEVLQLENLVLKEGKTPLYFIEFTGHLLDENVQGILNVLNQKFLLKHIGSYPV